MAKYLVDLSSTATTRYTGKDTDITKISNGDAASASTFNGPPQTLRERVERLRETVEDMSYVVDSDRALVMSLSGSLTATKYTGGTAAWGLGLSEGGSVLVRPMVATDATGSVTLCGAVKLTVSGAADAPKAWGQYKDGTPGPALRGANNISVTIAVTGPTPTVAVTDGDRVAITVPSGTTANQLYLYLNGDATFVAAFAALKLTASVLTGQDTTVITAVSTPAYITGATDNERHVVDAAALSAFFSTTTNRLEDGDTLALGYDTVVEMSAGSLADGGRRQIRSGTSLSGNLFNTRLNPEKIPGCIPLATVEGGVVVLLNGTVLSDGETVTGNGNEYLQKTGGTLSGPLVAETTVTVGTGITGNHALIKTASGEVGLAVGVSSSDRTNAPFRVTSTGAVTAAAVTGTDLTMSGNADIEGTLKAGTGNAFQVDAAGAITATGLNAGSGTIETTGLAKAANAVVSGTLGVGDSNYTDCEFRVTATGGVTATSLTTGSGAIGTTGAMSAGSLTVTGATTLGNGDLADAVVVHTDGTATTVGLAVGSTGSKATSAFKVYGDGDVDCKEVSASSKVAVTQDTANTKALTVTSSGTEKFSVDSDGDVVAKGALRTGSAEQFAVSSSGAVTAASVDAGSGTIKTTGDVVSERLGVGGTTYDNSEFKVTGTGAVTAASVNAGSGTIQTTGLVDTGSIYAGTNNEFVVETSGRVSAPDALIGSSADSASSGNVTVYNGINGGSAIRVYNTALNTNVMSFDVSAQGAVSAKNLTLGESDGDPDGQLLINNNNGSVLAIDVQNNSATKFSVSPAGAVVAAELTLGGVSVPPPENFQRIIYTGAWSVSSTSGGTNNTINVTASAGTYLATLAVSLNTNTGPAGETDWCLLTNTEDLTNSTRTPNDHATAGTAPYVSVHMTNGQSSALTITRVLTITANESLTALGFISSGSGAYLVRGSLTLIRIA